MIQCNLRQCSRCPEPLADTNRSGMCKRCRHRIDNQRFRERERQRLHGNPVVRVPQRKGDSRSAVAVRDFCGSPPMPEPTTVPPGTPEKEAVLAARASRGLCLFNPADARLCDRQSRAFAGGPARMEVEHDDVC
jgi:hypothetical protein